MERTEIKVSFYAAGAITILLRRFPERNGRANGSIPGKEVVPRGWGELSIPSRHRRTLPITTAGGILLYPKLVLTSARLEDTEATTEKRILLH